MKRRILSLLLVFSLLFGMNVNTITAAETSGTTPTYYRDDSTIYIRYDGTTTASYIKTGTINNSYVLNVGDTVNFKIMDSPADMIWTWSSGNTKKATITAEGKAAGKKAGEVTFTATSTYNGQGYKIKFRISVRKVQLPSKSVTLAKGQDFQASIIGTTAKTYKSSNAKVAKVTKKGVVTAVGVGKSTITIKAENKKTYKLKITVTKPDNNKYDNALKNAKGKSIVKFNYLTKKNTGYKINTLTSTYLKKNSLDYYYVRLGKSDNYYVLQLTKKPIFELREAFGYKAKAITSTSPLGPLGKFTGICDNVGGVHSQEVLPQYPVIKTDMGAFYAFNVTYFKGDENLNDNFPVYVMKKGNYYVTLYATPGSSVRIELSEIIKTLFNN